MVYKKGNNKIFWLEDNVQDVPKWIWASIIHSFHHMTSILTLEVVIKKEFMRIEIGIAYGSKIQYRKKKS